MIEIEIFSELTYTEAMNSKEKNVDSNKSMKELIGSVDSIMNSINSVQVKKETKETSKNVSTHSSKK